jgi:hypothetical protein
MPIAFACPPQGDFYLDPLDYRRPHFDFKYGIFPIITTELLRFHKKVAASKPTWWKDSGEDCLVITQ